MARRTIAAPHPVNPGGEFSGPLTIGSKAWAERWRLEVQAIWSSVPNKAERLARFWRLGAQHEVWKLLTRPDGTPFESFDEFCRGPYPWGLSRPATTLGDVERWIAMVNGTPEDIQAGAATACAPGRPPGYYWVSIGGDEPDIARFYGSHWQFDGLRVAEEHIEVLGPVAPYEPAPPKAQLARIRALQDAVQDAMENGAFASVGGLGKRTEMTLPRSGRRGLRRGTLARCAHFHAVIGETSSILLPPPGGCPRAQTQLG